MSRFIIACGGTGGHLAPGIAIAEALESAGHSCLLLISEKQVDSTLVAKYTHLRFQPTPGRAFGGGLRGVGAFVCGVISGFLKSLKMIREEAPDRVVLFGGFMSLGLGLAARFRQVPVALHEANVRPGKAIRLLKYVAHRLYLPDGVQVAGVASEKVRYLGYPVRREIQPMNRLQARERLGLESADRCLVIIGGSQGALALNEWVHRAFESLAEAGISVYCVTGLGKAQTDVLRHTNARGVTCVAKFVDFSDQMPVVISAADLVISRAGAGSIAEITRCGVPSILIPYPYAADNHQLANAEHHAGNGACVVVQQDELERLFEYTLALFEDRAQLDRYRANVAKLERFDSTERIVEDLLALNIGNLAKEASGVAS